MNQSSFELEGDMYLQQNGINISTGGNGDTLK